jgi:hypothetical protein
MSARAPSELLAQLDARLFERDRWFVIDRDQHKLQDAPTLARALQLVTTTRDAAAVVGRLAPGVAVVDVDAGGIEGDAIAENLLGWLVARGRWHLHRPSGGGQGRSHVFCVPGEDEEALAAFVVDLRISYGLPATKIDHRGAGGSSPWLRPLSSPHRRTGTTPLPTASSHELRVALDDLAGLLSRAARRGAAPARRPSARTRRAEAAAGRQVVPLVPLPRRREVLAPRWSAWLEGNAPAPHIGGGDQSRSAIELAATTALLRAGRTVDEAWSLVRTAEGGAFARSRARGRVWWIKYVWNAAVRSDTTWRETRSAAGTTDTTIGAQGRAAERPVPGPSEETAAAVAAARAFLRTFQWRLGARERPRVLLVAHLLLDRMEREDALTVPCPLRDLEVDSGASRNTVIAALRALDGRLGRRLATFDHTRADSSSHVFELDPRFQSPVVWLPEPPGVTPTHRLPGSWSCLPPKSHAVWRQLPAAGEPARSLTDLAQLAGMSHSPTALPTSWQRRTVLDALEELRSAGLAQQDGSGVWRRASHTTPVHQRRAAATHRLILERVTRERDTYRARVWSRWYRERLHVLRATRVRQERWWEGLSDHERHARRRRRAAWFAALPQREQARHKHRIAVARHRAGDISEQARHAAWCRQFDRSAQADRSAQWQAWFAGLAAGERAARVAHLEEHRRAWQLPGTWSTSTPLRSTPPMAEQSAA